MGGDGKMQTETSDWVNSKGTRWRMQGPGDVFGHGSMRRGRTALDLRLNLVME